MTCLDIETTITVKQYLCVLTDTNITANAASSTAILTQPILTLPAMVSTRRHNSHLSCTRLNLLP